MRSRIWDSVQIYKKLILFVTAICSHLLFCWTCKSIYWRTISCILLWCTWMTYDMEFFLNSKLFHGPYIDFFVLIILFVQFCQEIKSLFPSDCNPFYAGFGNRDTDEVSYLKVGIPKGKIFIINPKVKRSL